MSYKSRTGWNINACLRDDCINKNIKCEECIRYSDYETTKTKRERFTENK